MSKDDQTFKVEDAKCIRVTEKAILVNAPSLDEEEWVPQSQIHDDSEVWKTGDDGALAVTEWIAEAKSWL